MIMIIPILFLIHFVLITYASKKPGNAVISISSPVKEDVTEEELMQKPGYMTDRAHEIEQCRSDFAKIIKRSSGTGSSSCIASEIEVAHFAYAGNLKVT